MNEENLKTVRTISAVFSLIVVFLVLIFWVWPIYNVWSNGLHGKAELSRAEWNRKIAVQEAEARLASAKLDAESEVERAKGVAKANLIVADGLKNHEEYLRYLWIISLKASEHQVIYVPTEAGLPILEAGKR